MLLLESCGVTLHERRLDFVTNRVWVLIIIEGVFISPDQSVKGYIVFFLLFK